MLKGWFGSVERAVKTLIAAVSEALGIAVSGSAGGSSIFQLQNLVLEGFFLKSEHRLTDFDAARVDSTRRAVGGELCSMVTFEDPGVG